MIRRLRSHLGQLSWSVRSFGSPSRLARLTRVVRAMQWPDLPAAPGSIWGVTMVRDEQDIIAATIGHLFDQGVDHVLVADNRSTDATGAILRRLAAADPRVHVAYDAEPGYYQSEKMTVLAHAAWRSGAAWIIPFDADEFWFARGRKLAEHLRDLPAEVGVVKAAFHNMVKEDPDAELAGASFRMDPVPHRPGKVAFAAHRLAVVSAGNHGVARVGALTDGLFIAHAAYRGPGQVARKLRQGAAAVMLTRPGDTIARHWRSGGSLSDESIAEVWSRIAAGGSDDRIGWHVAGTPVAVRPLDWPTWDPEGQIPADVEPDSTLPPPRRSVAVHVPMLHLRGGGEKHGLGIAAALSADHDVTVYGRRPTDLTEVGGHFELDLSRCSFAVLPGPTLAERAAWRLQLPGDLPRTVQTVALFWWFRSRGHTWFVNAEHRSQLSCPTAGGLFLCMFPRQYRPARVGRLQRALAAVGVPAGLANPTSYPVIAANSDYTATWIDRYWGRPADVVLWPPCTDMRDRQVTRGPMILHVGRFFPRGGDENDKRQDVLIEAFATMTDLHEQGWELHLAGSVAASSPHHQAALDELRERAAGLPVVFHPNATFGDLRALYNQATIYWHATGYGTSVDADPARQEHFGITPVEAMSAGAVPVVYATAGPEQTVVDRVSGFHWRTVEELRARTRELAATPDGAARMGVVARDRAASYGWQPFQAAVRALLEG
ncbi:MAG: glycosyltransferase [Propioniciclava sp.]